jgi:hypothetical protein
VQSERNNEHSTWNDQSSLKDVAKQAEQDSLERDLRGGRLGANGVIGMPITPEISLHRLFKSNGLIVESVNHLRETHKL